MTLEELFEKVNSATGPDSDLDDMVWAVVAAGWDYPLFGSAFSHKRSRADDGEPQSYSSSIDAVEHLRKEHLPDWTLWVDNEINCWSCRLVRYGVTAPDDIVIDCTGPTEPLARLKAAILALIEQRKIESETKE